MPLINPFDLMRNSTRMQQVNPNNTNTINKPIAMKNGMQSVLCQSKDSVKKIPCWVNLSERVVLPMTEADASIYYPNLKV